jgi:uroporphyrinogen-III decarboxylase
MEINLRKNFLDALNGKKVGKIPALSVTQTGTVELMDMTGATWPEARSDPERMAALALAGYEIPDLQKTVFSITNLFCPTRRRRMVFPEEKIEKTI